MEKGEGSPVSLTDSLHNELARTRGNYIKELEGKQVFHLLSAVSSGEGGAVQH